jgi:hypothetical protein
MGQAARFPALAVALWVIEVMAARLSRRGRPSERGASEVRQVQTSQGLIAALRVALPQQRSWASWILPEEAGQ